MTTIIASLYETYIRGHRVTTDSRNIQPGDVFIALRGDNFNGNKFAQQALSQGAATAIIDDPEFDNGEGYILVENTLTFLQETAAYHRHRLGIPILGITGTNGKTTTKELCYAVLSRRFKTVATQGNLNNHIGVPLTLLSMDETTEFGIVEMGANHPGEIKILCDIADPDFGVITNIGQAHLEGFGSYENIISTKKQLYDHIFRKKGKVFVNAKDPLLMELSRDHNRILYGKAEAYLKGELLQSIPYMVYELKTLKGNLCIRTKLTGGYNFDNAMAASCIGTYFDVPAVSIQHAIEDYRPSNLRSQLIKTAHNTIILDAYNANPSSMAVALANFAEMSAPHKTVVLGEMRELGQVSEEAHRKIIDILQENHFNTAFLVGNNFEHCSNNLNFIRYFKDTDALIVFLKNHPLQGSCILVKGSRGNQLERIVEYL